MTLQEYIVQKLREAIADVPEDVVQTEFERQFAEQLSKGPVVTATPHITVDVPNASMRFDNVRFRAVRKLKLAAPCWRY